MQQQGACRAGLLAQGQRSQSARTSQNDNAQSTWLAANALDVEKLGICTATALG